MKYLKVIVIVILSLIFISCKNKDQENQLNTELTQIKAKYSDIDNLAARLKKYRIKKMLKPEVPCKIDTTIAGNYVIDDDLITVIRLSLPVIDKLNTYSDADYIKGE